MPGSRVTRMTAILVAQGGEDFFTRRVEARWLVEQEDVGA